MAEDPTLDYAKPTTPNHAPVFQLIREDVGRGVRWTLPADGEPVRRASRIVTGCATVLFVVGFLQMFAVGWLGQELTVRALTTSWIVGIVLALAAAHWRHIAGQPIVLDAQPDGLTLSNPAQLWGRTKRWSSRRLRSVRVHNRGPDLLTGKSVGMLYFYTRWTSYPLFNGLEVTELTDVAERIAAVTGTTVRKLRASL